MKRLDEIRERWASTSSSPWERYSRDFRGHRSYSVKAKSGMVVAHVGYGLDGAGAYTDAEAIAHAPTDIAALTAAVQAVLNKHRRVTEGSDEPYCRECFQAPYGHAPSPCPTVTVIITALEGTP